MSAGLTLARADIVSPAAIDAPSYGEVRNPARTDEVVGHYAQANTDVVDAVVAQAKAAAVEWGRLSGGERGRYLEQVAEAVDDGVPERAELLTREQGKVLWESQVDAGSGKRLFKIYAAYGDTIDREERIEDERGLTIIRRVPVGPTALIVPWNYPIYLCLQALAPALIAGNPVIVKPSEFAPLALTETLRIIADVLPDGVLSVINGDGAQAGAALVAHPDVRKVLFTGGIETGRAVLKAAAEDIKGVALELGGNDPAIVLDSATVDDKAMRELRRAVYKCSGQVCFNVKRIYVQRGIYDDFVDRFTAAVDEMVVGDGLNERSSIGPLNNSKQFHAVRSLVEQTEQDARVQTLGTKLSDADWEGGYFMLPSVVTGLPNEAPLVAIEQFGPVVPILPFDDEEQAIGWANDTQFGLAASVWTDDVDHGLDVARRIEAGSVFLNVHRMGASDQTMPFGGMKQSGLGRNHGMWAIDECTEMQAISHRPDRSHFPGPPV